LFQVNVVAYEVDYLKVLVDKVFTTKDSFFENDPELFSELKLKIEKLGESISELNDLVIHLEN
jgi:hypothetical protein